MMAFLDSFPTSSLGLELGSVPPMFDESNSDSILAAGQQRSVLPAYWQLEDWQHSIFRAVICNQRGLENCREGWRL